MHPIPFTMQDLRRVLSAASVERGRAYAHGGRVRERQYDPPRNRYVAHVQGSREDPYRVEATVLPGRAGAKVYGVCTCPMRINCKHVAAVLVDALARGAGTGVPDHAQQAPASRPAPAQRPGLADNTSAWLGLIAPEPAHKAEPPASQRRLFYVLDLEPDALVPRTCVQLVSAQVRKDGSLGDSKPSRYDPLQPPPRYVSPEDERIRRMLQVDSVQLYEGRFALTGAQAGELLRTLLATGRCHFARPDSPPLAIAPPRPAQPQWELQADATQKLAWHVTPPAKLVLPLAPPWYVDVERNECGPVASALSPGMAEFLARAPRIGPDDAGAVREELALRAKGEAVPLPEVAEEIVEQQPPVPHLYLSSDSSFGRTHGPFGYLIHRARLNFSYGGLLVGAHGGNDVRVVRAEQIVRIPRDRKAEKQAAQQLLDAGMTRLQGAPGTHYYTFYDDADWLRLLASDVPALRAQGWQIDIDPDFRFQLATLGDWYASVEEAGSDWFDLDLGVEIDGERLPLLPILVAAVRDRPDLLHASAAEASNGASPESLVVQLEDGRFAMIPVARVRPVLAVLHELIDQPMDVTVRLPRLDAARLADLDDASQLIWSGGEKLRELGAKLASFEGVASVPAPAGLRATLRPYQLQGLAWLQFLREYGLNGILADDMGLGKTVQTLAHILLEKQSGRLRHPALVVCPTSLVPNWKAEAARFTPDLKVHVSHGLKRKSAFGRIADHDIVITTYPLLARDREVLLEQPFHLAILDEAQQIKNAQTIAAKVTSQIRAAHRLCLTGTPLENHLGELWSLFHFLMPGFLGDARTFRSVYRTPIEKHGDDLRRASLVRRVRPFMLRRTKEQVAAELPAKTEIVVPVEIEGGQRDLYEAVRAAMDERVRREIAARGLQQSQIVVLDALLKLRQICCDPRLLKLQSAKAVKESAKLEALIELLEELVGGGHRVLLFSQFTSMLELIEKELHRREIAYVKLTGETRDRATPVQAFQSGSVPLFLISLKAGGTGLNLTAADTVVHYDPWWNPAVENQATDRAHRIGQDRPVFVYKLIVSGSVEEKIARLQASKAALASAVLGEGKTAGPALTAEDIKALFEPLG